mmetsp:Transcript_71933/g.141100  ORF Transcript_71933/g.141100 Transcript_71933/m.141100 type:complete len:88 (+) Transcript_71933:44-307(+)
MILSGVGDSRQSNNWLDIKGKRAGHKNGHPDPGLHPKEKHFRAHTKVLSQLLHHFPPQPEHRASFSAHHPEPTEPQPTVHAVSSLGQ